MFLLRNKKIVSELSSVFPLIWSSDCVSVPIHLKATIYSSSEVKEELLHSSRGLFLFVVPR